MTSPEFVDNLPPVQQINPDYLISLDRQAKWYEVKYDDVGEFSVQHVLDMISARMKPLVDYADTYKAYFFATVDRTSSDRNTWTFMPAYKDKDIVEKTAAIYAEKLKSAWGHVLIGPSDDSFNDSEHVGVMDKDLKDNTFAFDVTQEGIAVDNITITRGKTYATPSVFIDWNGQRVANHELDPETNKQVVIAAGRVALFD
jgi:hypothetical protein